MNNKGKKWTVEDDNFLVEKWGSLKLESIAKSLGRTQRSVQDRAYHKLKLGQQIQWYTLKEIQDMTGINKDTIRKRIIRSGIKHIRGKTKQKPYMLDDTGLRKFLKDNQDLWHTKNLTINIFTNEKWYLDKVETDKAKVKKLNKTWTEYEDNVLLMRLKEGYSYEDIAKELGRTADGCFGRHRYKYRLKY